MGLNGNAAKRLEQRTSHCKVRRSRKHAAAVARPAGCTPAPPREAGLEECRTPQSCRKLHELRPWGLLAVSRPRRHQWAALLERGNSRRTAADRRDGRPPRPCWRECALALARTPRGRKLVASAAQSRNELRNPCTVKSCRPMRFSTAPSVMSDIGLPVRIPGNTSCTGSDPKCLISSRIASARGESGTLCSRRAFIRSAGIIHTSLAISAQQALRTSPERAAVKIANSSAPAAMP